MKKTLILIALSAVSFAAAQTIDTYPDWGGSVTSGWMGNAQTFIAPNTNLSSFQFNLLGGGSQVTLSVYAWNDGAGGPQGSALYSNTISYTGAGDYLFSNMNVALTSGAEYGAWVDFDGYTGQSTKYNTNQNSYNLGNAWWYSTSYGGWNNYPGSNMTFKATFNNQAVPEPSSLVALAGFAVPLLRRRRATK